MNTCLVLFTKAYPFDKGEEFIEDEVPFLAKAFSKVILIATSTADKPVQTRNVPENVDVHFIRASAVKRLLPLTALRFLPFTSCNGYATQAERAFVKGSLKKRVYLTYFLAKSEAVYEEASKILAPYQFNAFDGVTFYSYWLYDIALAASRFKKYCTAEKKKVISRAHRYDLYADLNSMNYLPLRPYLFRNLDHIYPCSQNGADALHAQCAGFEEKITASYLGTKDCGLNPQPSETPIHFVSCCHISPVKRVELLAQAFAKLKDSSLRLKWTHFGDGAALNELKQYAKEHLSFMEVTFAGSIKNPDLMEYYRSNSVNWFVNTSSSEGLPVSIMEACSFGIPVLATNVGGTSEIVRENETGFLLDADITSEQLAKKLKDVCETDPQTYQRLRSQSRAVWEQNFCAEHNFEAFAQQIQPE